MARLRHQNWWTRALLGAAADLRSWTPHPRFPGVSSAAGGCGSTSHSDHPGRVVIGRPDIVERVSGWQLTEEVIEKDYVLGWLLWGIGADPVLGDQWVFKGGTCLKKCYIETYRFSEDLHFTVLPRSVPATSDRTSSPPGPRSGPRR